ncbi:hypothetical protein DSL72_004224 [Monilinia vaccinii-corymbosi]|uniref:Uncharacterized protein n=1 Tax=Monilinia vaccinii-corymbosi TaxID=61207 RepID=A0A8A3P9N9_9HELO|nr:hypothetical protein DSL72_004224 [Monilinia vaccinii-corymbosi]
MTGGTTHHCPSVSKGNCRPGDIPGSQTGYCKAHQVYCENPEGCNSDLGFIARTDICETCKWKHPDHQDFERERKDQNAQAVKEAHEKRIKLENEKKANEAKARREKKATAAKEE